MRETRDEISPYRFALGSAWRFQRFYLANVGIDIKFGQYTNWSLKGIRAVDIKAVEFAPLLLSLKVIYADTEIRVISDRSKHLDKIYKFRPSNLVSYGIGNRGLFANTF